MYQMNEYPPNTREPKHIIIPSNGITQMMRTRTHNMMAEKKRVSISLVASRYNLDRKGIHDNP